jgi:hypothetical protein
MVKGNWEIAGERRLAYEIRTKRNNLLDALDKYQNHPHSQAIKITDIRRDLDVLQGLVFGYIYATEKWTHNTHMTLTEEVNNIIMLWLSVDLIKMYEQAAKKPKPHNNDSTPGEPSHGYREAGDI